ncbi:FtsX-like permease family protein [Carnobacteriaceae bacterium zg-ZUI252]|nr:FtsX-like permease family protein [Carnobacteriaceae bacterium zg-ZUI252]
MKKRTLHLTIKKAITQSLGRFISIMSLMALGAFGLVGLKVTGPNINTTVQEMMQHHHAADFTVLADYGLSSFDQEELSMIPNSQIEFGYFSDTIIDHSAQSIRVFSNTQNISTYAVQSGRLPENQNEVALTATLQDRYTIGDSIELNETKSKKLLKTHTFKVVGFVHSNEFISTKTLGASTSGSGTLRGFAVVTPDTFDSSVFTIARIAFPELATLNTYSKSYEDKINELQKNIESLLLNNGSQRINAIQSDASTSIADGERKIDEALKKLADARQQIDDAQQDINTNQHSVESGLNTLAQNEKKLQQSKVELDNAKKVLTQTKEDLDSGKKQLDDGFSQLQETKIKLDNAKEAIVQGQKQIDDAQLQLQQSKQLLDHTKAQLDRANSEIVFGKEQLSALRKQIDDYEALLQSNPTQANEKGITSEVIETLNHQYTTQSTLLATKENDYTIARSQYTAGVEQYDSSKVLFDEQNAQFQAKRADYEEGLLAYQDGYTTLQNKQLAYSTGLEQYHQGMEKYERGFAEYQSGFKQIQATKERLLSGKTELVTAQNVLDEKKETFNEEEARAKVDIEKAQADIADAKAQLQELVEPEYRVYTRSSMLGGEGYTTIKATSDGISSVGNMFPVVLYAVAALVTLTTMTRFVNEERTNAGVLKALGYTNADVYKKFTHYGLIAGLTGTMIGIFAGMYLLPLMIGKTLLSTTILPDLPLTFHWPIAIVSILISIFCSVVPALLIAKRELKDSAASLLLPKPPAKASSILLERIPWVWRRLNFTQKVTARNIFRYKQRMFMTIFGVAGSLALLFSGLGILSSLNGVVSRQYHHIIQYDALVIQHDNVDEKKAQTIQEKLSQLNVDHHLSLYSKNYVQKIEGVINPQTITLLATNQSFDGYINLYDAQTKKPLTLSDSGVILTEKMAAQLNVSVGDTLALTDAHGNTFPLHISGIAEMYAGHFIFMNDKAYERFFHTSWHENTHLMKLNSSEASYVESITAEFMAIDGVKAVVQNLSIQQNVNTLVRSLTQIMVILTIASILLAIVILYNLTTINVAERIRELSTIKVLGFFNREVTLYIYRETILLSLIGIVLGLVFGRILHYAIIQTVATPFMMFNPQVEWWVYIVPTIVIITIVVLLGVMVNKQLKRVDMLEALKSVD